MISMITYLLLDESNLDRIERVSILIIYFDKDILKYNVSYNMTHIIFMD